MIFALTLLFWLSIALGLAVAWWMYRLATAMRGIESDPIWRGVTRDE